MSDFWVVDIEASGLSSRSYPIEIGLFNGTDHYQTLICPEEEWQHWNARAESLHGLSRHYLEKHGSAARKVCEEINNLVGGCVLFSDHDDWDGFWLQRLYASTGVQQQFLVASLIELLGQGKQEEFSALVSELRRRGEYRSHRALDDAGVFHQAAQFMLQKNAT